MTIGWELKSNDKRGDDFMKKKLYSIIFMALFFLAASAFYFEGSTDNVIANQDPIVSDEVPKLEKDITKEQNIGQSEIGNNKDKGTQNETIKQEDTSEELKEPEEIIENKTEPSVPEENKSEDIIEMGGYLYVNIMHETKFKHLINVAQKYDSKLYAVPNTDLFAIVKNGEPILHKSTGISSVSVSLAPLLVDVFSGDGFVYKGITENINFVAETGAKVNVEFSQYEAYSIYQKDGWITVSW